MLSGLSTSQKQLQTLLAGIVHAIELKDIFMGRNRFIKRQERIDLQISYARGRR